MLLLMFGPVYTATCLSLFSLQNADASSEVKQQDLTTSCMNVLQGYLSTCALSTCLPRHLCFWSSDCLCMYATLSAKQDLSCMYLAHHELESVFIIVIVVVYIPLGGST